SRDEQARKSRGASGQDAGRTAFDDSQATVVPVEDVVPEPTRPGRGVRDYAPAPDYSAPADIELSTSDIRVADVSGEIDDPDYPPAPPPRPTGRDPLPPPKTSGRYNAQFDFTDESQATRFDPRIDPRKDIDPASVEVQMRREPPTRQTASPPPRETYAPTKET